MQNIDVKTVDKALEKYGKNKSSIIPILQYIQKEYRYLPMELLKLTAEKIGISQAKIYGVATFYENFSFEPKGKYVLKICDGTACHVRKSLPILDALRKYLKLKNKKQKTSEDMLFTVETVSCLGACGLAPVITINDKVHPAMTPEAAIELIEILREEEGNNYGSK